jgi:hypothetical protein
VPPFTGTLSRPSPRTPLHLINTIDVPRIKPRRTRFWQLGHVAMSGRVKSRTIENRDGGSSSKSTSR